MLLFTEEMLGFRGQTAIFQFFDSIILGKLYFLKLYFPKLYIYYLFLVWEPLPILSCLNYSLWKGLYAVKMKQGTVILIL